MVATVTRGRDGDHVRLAATRFEVYNDPFKRKGDEHPQEGEARCNHRGQQRSHSDGVDVVKVRTLELDSPVQITLNGIKFVKNVNNVMEQEYVIIVL